MIRLTRILLTVLLAAAFGLPAAAQRPDTEGPVIVAYVTSWSGCMPDTRLVTHINYAFGHVNDTFDGVRIDNPERLHAIAALKENAPDIRVMLSIGGWGSGRFSEMAATDSTRNAFAADCLAKVEEFGLDGIDIDWEYPTSGAAGISSSPQDTENFTLLMQDLRRVLGNDRLLTLASVAFARYIDFKAIEPYVDFVNIMTYDIALPPHHHAALYRSSMTGGISCEESVRKHIDAGIPASKLVMGIPFYGRGGDNPGGFCDYKVLAGSDGYTPMWDDTAKAPYLADSTGRMVYTYETPRSIALKCKFIRQNNLLGAMYWDYDGDDAEGTLRNAVHENLFKACPAPETGTEDLDDSRKD